MINLMELAVIPSIYCSPFGIFIFIFYAESVVSILKCKVNSQEGMLME